MRFDVVCWLSASAAFGGLVGGSSQQGEGVADGGDDIEYAQEHQRLHVLQSQGFKATVATALRTCIGLVRLVVSLCGSPNQGGKGGEVVGQYLCGDIDDERLLAQPGDGFKFAVLEPFKGLLNFPAGVLAVAEAFVRELCAVQIGRHHPRPVSGRHIEHVRAEGLGGARQVCRVLGDGGIERDLHFIGSRTQEPPQGRRAVSASQRVTKQIVRSQCSALNHAAR